MTKINPEPPRVGEHVRLSAQEEMERARNTAHTLWKGENYSIDALSKNPAMLKYSKEYLKLRKKSLQEYSNEVELFIKEQVKPEEFEAIKAEVMKSKNIEDKIINFLPTTEQDIKEEILIAQEKIKEAQKTPKTWTITNKIRNPRQ